MAFREQLVRYMEALKVNGSQLAQVTGMTSASISRYRTGIRVPAPESEIVNKLAQGLAALASDRGMPGFEEREIVQSLNEGIREDFASNPSAHVNYKILQGNLDRLMGELNLSGKDLAAAVHYDVSQIYRIRNGKRNPSNPARFVESVVRYVLQTCSSKSERAIIAHLIGWPGAIEGDPSDSQGECFRHFCSWLSHGLEGGTGAEEHSVHPAEPFHLHRYLRNVEGELPPEPDSTHGKRCYEGRGGLDRAVRDFMHMTVHGNSYKDVYIYSDFPVDERDAETDKSRRYAQGIVEMMQQGLHINTIHLIDRTFNDVLFDFSLWLPLYLSGQVSPYYLKGTEGAGQTFRHIIMVSGSAVMCGVGIARHEEESSFILTRNRSEIARLLTRVDYLLQQAQLLSDVYGSDREDELMEFLDRDADTAGDRLSYSSPPPLHAISKELMDRILKRNGVSGEDTARIRACAKGEYDRVLRILKQGRIKALFAGADEEEVEEHPPQLSLPESCTSRDITYTYDEYVDHVEDARAFARTTRGYELIERKRPLYRNMNIMVHRREWAIVSRADKPPLHLVITQPALCERIETMMLLA